MRLAIAEARLSKGEDTRVHPLVGVVVVKNGVILAQAHRGELGEGDHAEYTALEKKLKMENLTDATVYTTLEPCTTRKHPAVPCAKRLIERKVARVVIGMLDPNPNISGKGQISLRNANIETVLFSEKLMSEVEELNRDFIRMHTTRRPSRPVTKADLDRMALHVTNLLFHKGWRWAGFEKIRKHVNNPAYSDEQLMKMVDRMPQKFRIIILRDDKPAIGFTKDFEAQLKGDTLDQQHS